jgi:tetratricopeptide (TPR) repeat protein
MTRRFGRYVIRDELTDELGRGAFGRVYRAFDPNVNRYVAIKVLSSGSDPDMLDRFQDESKTAGQLEHENIVKIYDFDLQDGMPYLVMELLDGETLETVIKTRKIAGLPIQLLDKVEIMFQVAKGLQYAHSENVVHRDIKPGNIMVLPNGTVKVMDFGIARVMDKDGTRRTRQGDIAGTILYMAPEQFSGRDADKRTDIFAYADVYYELLTGEHPFFGTDFATVMYRITANEPRPIREKLPECPVALENMIHRLLVKDPEIRPDRLDEVVLETRPVLLRLRRERAAVVAAEIEPLITAGDLDQAQIAIRQVLQWDPLNQTANLWREGIQKERERKTASARAEALVSKGHEHLAARRFKEALQSFESALKLDQTNPEIRRLVDRVRNTIDNVHSAGRLVAEARTEMERGELEHAVDKAARAAELDSGNPEAPRLRDQLRQQIRNRLEAALLARAESLCNDANYDGAVAVLSEVEASGSSNPKITACRTRVERERDEAEKRRRQDAFAEALARAREALDGRLLHEASDSAEALCAEYPEEPAASELLSEVREYLAAQRRLEAINQATQTARVLMKEKRLNDAREVLEAGLRAYPRDTGISRLMEIVNTLATAQERARKIGRVVRQAHSLADGGQLDEALRAVLDAIGEFGEETALVECKRNFQLERDQREYARGLQARLEQGRRLLAEGNPSGAVGLLEDAMLQYPGEPEIALLLSSARAALTSLRESEFVKQHRSRIAALETVGQYGTALALMEAALARYPGNAELLETAGRLRQKL